MKLESNAFRTGERIPARHTADGEGVSPELHWDEVPRRAVSLALVALDPDAPRGTFTHWVAWNIPPTQTGFHEGLESAGQLTQIKQGTNGFGGVGWRGPQPPPGPPHRYVFRVYALDVQPELAPGATREDLERAIQGHVLEEATLTGTYGR